MMLIHGPIGLIVTDGAGMDLDAAMIADKAQ